MPRKAFVADLKQAVSSAVAPGVSDVQAGEEDGTFTFSFTPTINELIPIKIQALIPDVSEYPSSHQCYLYTISDAAPSEVSSTLEQLTDATSGLQIHQLLSAVSASLSKALAPGSHNDEADPMDTDGESQADYGTEASDFDDGFLGEGIRHTTARLPDHNIQDPKSNFANFESEDYSKNLKARIRRDLRAAKDAGLKVSILGDLMQAGEGGFVSISCRIAKLGISQEALKAWGLESDQYLIFLIRYNSGYMTAEQLASGNNLQARRSVEMHVRVSSRYKPTFQQAVSVFASGFGKKTTATSSSAMEQDKSEDSVQSSLQRGLDSIFIGRPLDQLLNDRLVLLLKSRLEIGLNWAGAERFYNDHQGKNQGHSNDLLARYHDPDPPRSILPAIVAADHISEVKLAKKLSFPLLGMQFVFRHLVRCTEFCLVCHCKVPATSEALKPYVCDKPLCLYQYMTLGFGPSLEYEIRSQPEVVDLLVSFCCVAAKGMRLTGFPTGMGLMVPPTPTTIWNDAGFDWNQAASTPPPFLPTAIGGLAAPVSVTTAVGPVPCPPVKEPDDQKQRIRYTVTVYRDELKVLFQKDKDYRPLYSPVKTGDWVVIRETNERRTSHCQITETAYFPVVHVSQFITATEVGPLPVNGVGTVPNRPNNNSAVTAQKKETAGLLVVYDQNFDLMSAEEKHETISYLLDILPGILEMKSYLSRKGWAENSLSKWTDRIPPALLGILRWIVASNRSCIMYVGSSDSTDERNEAEQQIYGMQGWLQFRFAQGAPDKEQRFISSLMETTQRLKLKYPSIFAWHGSPLWNWHGIIREGLHFKRRDHGRAFGDGCYHSLDFHTSATYSHYRPGPSSYETVPNYCWRGSFLKFTHAMCLNEIVNAPNEFVSKTPHLVINQLDWIQTRYLFVQSPVLNQTTSPTELPKPSLEYPQDPSYTPRGANQGPIIIPLCLVSKVRRTLIPGLPEYKRKEGPAMQKLEGNRKQKRQKLLLPNQSSHASINSTEEDKKDGGKKVTGEESDGDVYEVDENGNRLIDDEDDNASVKTTQSDLDLLALSEDESEKKEGGDTKMVKLGSSFSMGNPSLKDKANNPTDFVPGKLDYKTLPIMQPPSYATPAATKTLQRELKSILKAQTSQPSHELGWYIDSEHVGNIYQWIIELHSFDPKLPLSQDLKKIGLNSIVLEIRFGQEYPISPPFVRVIRPRFRSFAQGGGGHVTAGGALCMQLLTNSGWSAVSTIESVLLQVRMAISSTEPFPARLEDGQTVRDYGIGEAVEAYIRACKMHGWEVPKDFHRLGSAS